MHAEGQQRQATRTEALSLPQPHPYTHPYTHAPQLVFAAAHALRVKAPAPHQSGVAPAARALQQLHAARLGLLLLLLLCILLRRLCRLPLCQLCCAMPVGHPRRRCEATPGRARCPLLVVRQGSVRRLGVHTLVLLSEDSGHGSELARESGF